MPPSGSEPVDVVVSFSKNRVIPHRFRSAGRVYDIKRVNLVHATREGRAKVFVFSVSDDTNFWKLRFDTESLEWRVVEQFNSHG